MSSSGKSSFLPNSSFITISATPVMNNSSVSSVPEGCMATEFFQFIPWDNEDNIVSKDVDNVFNLVFTGICLPCLFIVSFCTNIINMIVFYKHGLEERINACLFTLSLVDLFSISVAFAYGSDVIYMFITGKGGSLGPSSQFFTRNYLVGFHGLNLASQMVYSVIALERCLCVTRPLLVKTLMPTKTTVVVLLTMVIVVTGFNVFMGAILYSVLCVFDLRDGNISFISYPRTFYFQNKLIIDIIYSLVNGLVLPGFCFICVTVCTFITAVKMKKLTQWREQVSSASGSVSSRDLAITRVIIVTSILFIVCIVPSVAMPVSIIIVPDLGIGGRYDNMAWVIRRFYQLCTAINNTFNFFIYYTFGSKFRETTNRLFSFCTQKKLQTSK